MATLINRPAGKIFISKVVINHIKNRHGGQILRQTSTAIIDYVRDTLSNVNEVYEGNDNALILAHRKETTANLVIVEECVLEFIDGSYRVKTAYKTNVNRLNNKKTATRGKNI